MSKETQFQVGDLVSVNALTFAGEKWKPVQTGLVMRVENRRPGLRYSVQLEDGSVLHVYGPRDLKLISRPEKK